MQEKVKTNGSILKIVFLKEVVVFKLQLDYFLLQWVIKKIKKEHINLGKEHRNICK